LARASLVIAACSPAETTGRVGFSKMFSPGEFVGEPNPVIAGGDDWATAEVTIAGPACKPATRSFEPDATLRVDASAAAGEGTLTEISFVESPLALATAFETEALIATGKAAGASAGRAVLAVRLAGIASGSAGARALASPETTPVCVCVDAFGLALTLAFATTRFVSALCPGSPPACIPPALCFALGPHAFALAARPDIRDEAEPFPEPAFDLSPAPALATGIDSAAGTLSPSARASSAAAWVCSSEPALDRVAPAPAPVPVRDATAAVMPLSPAVE
jgi:hypothetical protein